MPASISVDKLLKGAVLKTIQKRVATLSKRAAYVGVPGSKASAANGDQDISNAQKLLLFTKGSPLRNQPPRPVLEPAVLQARQRISHELGASAKAHLEGDDKAALTHLKRAAMVGQNEARANFTDPRNRWAPNSPRTVEAKGSDQPGIDTGAMRKAIIGFVGDDDGAE